MNYIKQMIHDWGGMTDFNRVSLKYIANIFFPSKSASILDAGAGSGVDSFFLKTEGWNNLCAFDIDDHNKKEFEKHGLEFNKLDASQDVFPYENGQFDVIFSSHVIEHLHNPKNFLEESHRVLKTGGKLIIITPNWRKQVKTFWRDHTHVHPYDKESIQRILECFDFRPIWIKNFGVLRFCGRTNLWKVFPRLMFTGIDIIAVSEAH